MTTYKNFSGSTVSVSATTKSTIWGSGTETLTGGSAPTQLYNSGQVQTMIAGSGDTTFVVSNSKDTIIGGVGVDTVVTFSDFTLPTNVENLTINSQWATVTVHGNAAANLIVADKAGDTVWGEGGDDVLISAGGDTFGFAKGSGHDVLYNFKGGAGGDLIRLVDYGLRSFSAVQGALSQSASGVTLTLSPTDAILFSGAKLADFTAANFDLGYYNFGGAQMAVSVTSNNIVWGVATETLTGTNTPTTLYNSGQVQTMVAGKGDTTFVVSNSQDVVVGGAGVDTVLTYSDFTLPTGVENATLNGKWALPTVHGNAGGNLIVADKAGETIWGEGGDDVLVSAGGDTFGFAKGSGHDVVVNFKGGAGGDLIKIDGYTLGTFASVQAAMTQSANGVTLALSSTDAILFQGAKISDFAAANFQLATAATVGGVASGYTTAVGAAVEASTHFVTTVWGAATETLTGGAAPTQLYNSGKGQTLVAGSGDTTFGVSNSHDVVVGGPGVDTVVASADFTLPTNVENLTINSQYGPVVAHGNAASNLIIADAANDIIYGEAGNDVLVSAGGDTFVFAKGSGSDAIYKFHGGSNGDIIRLDDYGFTSFDQVKAALTQVGADTQLTLSPTDSILLKNVSASSLTAANFQLQIDTTQLKMTFSDDFSSLSLYNPQTGTGTWKTNYAWGNQNGLDSHTVTGDVTVFSDASFTGSGSTPVGVNPFSISNGVLDIHAAATTAQTASQLWGYQYTGGLLTTEKSFSQEYGYFEIRAQVPTEKGAWPAFWLVPTDGSYSGELDVLEDVGDKDGTVHSTVHSGTDGATQVGFAIDVPNLTAGFHTYGMLWTAKEIDFFVDGVEVAATATPAGLNKPAYLIVSEGAGGWAGTPAPDFSADFKVDYIHAYALPDAGSAVGLVGAAMSGLGH